MYVPTCINIFGPTERGPAAHEVAAIHVYLLQTYYFITTAQSRYKAKMSSINVSVGCLLTSPLATAMGQAIISRHPWGSSS